MVIEWQGIAAERERPQLSRQTLSRRRRSATYLLWAGIWKRFHMFTANPAASTVIVN
jgi:hypothetical protein